MQVLKTVSILLALLVMLMLSGCGSSSGGPSPANDPLTTSALIDSVGKTGLIMFTDKAGQPPGEQSNMLEPWEIKDVDPAVTASVAALQLLPFRVVDSNGNPRVGVPITLSVYSLTGNTNMNEVVTIDFLVPYTTPQPNTDTGISEPNQRTITTDSAGMGIFNVRVTQSSPPVGSFTSLAAVFKATTSDTVPVTAYVGGLYSITAIKPR